jgi:nucleoside-diphosphate-sugar epimerase
MTVSVLGCGWLGEPLGVHLVGKKMKVKGSTTKSPKLRVIDDDGIEPYLIRLGPDRIEGDIAAFLESDILVLNFPPNGNSNTVEEVFPKTVRRIIEAVKASPLRKIIFVSSTSVYGDQHGEPVDEDAELKPERPSGRALVEVETMMMDEPELDVTILRMGGLVGGVRKPYLFLVGRSDLNGGEMPVNLVHQSDAIDAITAVIEQEAWGEVFNVVADLHPSRREYYTYAATQNNMTPPRFLPDQEPSGKSVSNDKIKRKLGFEFAYSDPFHML